MKNITHLRESMGVSLRFIAELIGCDKSNLLKAQKSKRSLNIDQIDMMSQLLTHTSEAANRRSAEIVVPNPVLEKRLAELLPRFEISQHDFEAITAVYEQFKLEFHLYEQMKDTPFSEKVMDFELKYRKAWTRYRNTARKYHRLYTEHHLLAKEISLIKEVLGIEE